MLRRRHRVVWCQRHENPSACARSLCYCLSKEYLLSMGTHLTVSVFSLNTGFVLCLLLSASTGSLVTHSTAALDRPLHAPAREDLLHSIVIQRMGEHSVRGHSLLPLLFVCRCLTTFRLHIVGSVCLSVKLSQTGAGVGVRSFHRSVRLESEYCRK